MQYTINGNTYEVVIVVPQKDKYTPKITILRNIQSNIISYWTDNDLKLSKAKIIK